MYNEAANVARTLARVREALAESGLDWELILVDDGSTDGSRAAAEEAAGDEPRIRVLGHTPNAGRGRALREGITASRGEVVVTGDFDLSYDPGHHLRLREALIADPELHLVLGSVYMPGGRIEGVPRGRVLVSRLGNALLRQAFGRRFHTLTCVLRAYRGETVRRMRFEADRKEFHLESLTWFTDLGLGVAEIPATLVWPGGERRSTLRLPKSVPSHLGYVLSEAPTGFLLRRRRRKARARAFTA
jgi:glycosyltransferase involved in cell wall biosynthesis